MARGDYILFTDSDCLVDQDILKHYLRHFPADGLGGVGGNVVPDSKGIISQYLEHMGVWRPGRGESGIIYLVTANAFFLRDAVVKAGGFDEDFRRPGGEEPELCYRMLGKGFRFECDENAVVIHSHKLTLKSIMRMFFAYGRGRAIFVKKWPDVALWHLPTSFFSWGCTVLGVEAIRRFRFDFVRKFSLGRALVFLVLEYSRILARLYGYRSAMKERGRIHSSTQRGSSDLQSSDKDQRG
jgi:GT2 family glycosyltransferase